jgi:hypothetical protein
MYGSCENAEGGEGVKLELEFFTRDWVGKTHLVQVHDAHGNFAQTLAPVDVGLGGPGDTTSAKL